MISFTKIFCACNECILKSVMISGNENTAGSIQSKQHANIEDRRKVLENSEKDVNKTTYPISCLSSCSCGDQCVYISVLVKSERGVLQPGGVEGCTVLVCWTLFTLWVDYIDSF